MCKILYSPIEELGVSLSSIQVGLSETEFWMSCLQYPTEQIESIVASSFFPKLARTPVHVSNWHGMLMGFADLLFECDGKFYVLDYKTNTLGLDLKDY
jgi:exodeoxyribonuclease V beta subunit